MGYTVTVLGHVLDTSVGHPVRLSDTLTCLGYPVPAFFLYCSGTNNAAIALVFQTSNTLAIVLGIVSELIIVGIVLSLTTQLLFFILDLVTRIQLLFWIIQ